MKRPVHYAEARRILGRVASTNRFWLCTNENLRNLPELAASLERVDDDVFRYHVNRDKNDFEVWIRDVIKDKELAREISRVKTRETLVRKINERVEGLRKVTRLHKAVLERKRARAKRAARGRLKKRRAKKQSKRRKKVTGKVKRAKRRASYRKKRR